MLKTFQWYISRELLWVMCLATFAFTIVFTMIVIIDPLRENGLDANQAVQFFFLTLPFVLSLTLPVASLFAVTFVYGRMAQDRELSACRASGISEVTLLMPGVVLGTLVTVLTLLMTNLISPRMYKSSEEILFKNARKLIFHKIKTEGHYKFPRNNILLHASHVRGENLYGVAIGQVRARRDEQGKIHKEIQQWLASGARIEIKRSPDTGDYFISFRAENPVGPHTLSPAMSFEGRAEDFPFRRYPLPRFDEEQLGCFDSYELLYTLDHPVKFARIRQQILKLKQRIRSSRFIESVSGTLQRGGSYAELIDDSTGRKLVISAPVVVPTNDEVVLSSGPGSSDSPAGGRRVRLVERAMGINWTHEADRGAVTLYDATESGERRVTVLLKGNIVTKKGGKVLRRSTQREFDCSLPYDRILEKASVDDIYNNVGEYTSNPSLHKYLNNHIKGDEVEKLRGKIVAQLHFRNTYGLNCVFLVALGAVLAVFFSTGHFLLSSFVLTVIPLTASLVSMIMGKRLISNPDSPDLVGVFLMWLGIGVLLAVNAFLYHRLSRR